MRQLINQQWSTRSESESCPLGNLWWDIHKTRSSWSVFRFPANRRLLQGRGPPNPTFPALLYVVSSSCEDKLCPEKSQEEQVNKGGVRETKQQNNRRVYPRVKIHAPTSSTRTNFVGHREPCAAFSSLLASGFTHVPTCRHSFYIQHKQHITHAHALTLSPSPFS